MVAYSRFTKSYLAYNPVGLGWGYVPWMAPTPAASVIAKPQAGKAERKQ